MKSWARLPYRCRVCRKRFYRLEPALAGQRDKELEMIGEAEEAPEPDLLPVPKAASRRRYRVVIRIRLPRLLRSRPVSS